MLEKGLLRIALLSAVGLVAAVVVISAAGTHGATDKAALKDVKLTGCVRDAAGRARVEGTLHNSTSDRSDYFIDIVIDHRSGKRLDKITSITRWVFPDQTTLWEANTMVHYTRGLTCSLVGVVRSPTVLP